MPNAWLMDVNITLISVGDTVISGRYTKFALTVLSDRSLWKLLQERIACGGSTTKWICAIIQLK